MQYAQSCPRPHHPTLCSYTDLLRRMPPKSPRQRLPARPTAAQAASAAPAPQPQQARLQRVGRNPPGLQAKVHGRRPVVPAAGAAAAGGGIESGPWPAHSRAAAMAPPGQGGMAAADPGVGPWDRGSDGGAAWDDALAAALGAFPPSPAGDPSASGPLALQAQSEASSSVVATRPDQHGRQLPRLDASQPSRASLAGWLPQGPGRGQAGRDQGDAGKQFAKPGQEPAATDGAAHHMMVGEEPFGGSAIGMLLLQQLHQQPDSGGGTAGMPPTSPLPAGAGAAAGGGDVCADSRAGQQTARAPLELSIRLQLQASSPRGNRAADPQAPMHPGGGGPRGTQGLGDGVLGDALPGSAPSARERARPRADGGPKALGSGGAGDASSAAVHELDVARHGQAGGVPDQQCLPDRAAAAASPDMLGAGKGGRAQVAQATAAADAWHAEGTGMGAPASDGVDEDGFSGDALAALLGEASAALQQLSARLGPVASSWEAARS